MEKNIQIHGQQVAVSFSDNVKKMLDKQNQSLLVEMELYFSCLIRKKVRFYQQADCSGAEKIEGVDNLYVAFRPVMTASCNTDYEGDEPPLTDFPIAKPESFVPHWLKLDYRNNQWQGEFGYK